jgi:excisionase family DNA binding protein
MSPQKYEKSTTQQGVWSPEQLAVMLHVSVRKIRQAIENGQLMAEKVGNTYAISQEAISEFLKQGNPFFK